MPGWLVLFISTAYVGVLFLIAWWTDRQGAGWIPPRWLAAVGYSLTLAVYNTSWSFYGSVGRAVNGFDFLSIYIGPTLVLLLGQRLVSKIITVAKSQNITSISDFIAARYGKSHVLAALVTMAALLAVLPYIALQLKAVGTSFEILTSSASPSKGGDTTFAVAASMALFAIMFGVRHIHASEHHRGLMAAIAFESMVKLSAFVMVALYIVFGMFDGFGDLFARAQADVRMGALLTPDFSDPTWISNTVIAAISFLCLPHMFHVAVVENKEQSQARAAAWLYPLYLLIFSCLMVPIAIAGLATFADNVNPDTYVISLPLAAHAPSIALLAFIGGLSAATGMVIVASVALSTMLCNDVIIPVLLRSRLLASSGRVWPSPSMLLLVRRASVAAILFLAYMMNRMVDQAYPLTVIGLLSFVAIAQFGPAFVGGLLWRRANGGGAVAGIVVGFGFWIYTLLIPSIAPLLPAVDNLITNGPLGITWLKPQSLFGISGLDPISHATLWSLGANLTVFIALSLLMNRSSLERRQAEAFVGGMPVDQVPLASLPLVTRLDDLKALAARFVGPERSKFAFENFMGQHRSEGDGAKRNDRLADLEAMRFTENLIAGALGAASARVVMAAALESRSFSRKAAVMLDEASQALHFNRKLLQGALESVPQGICVFDANLNIEAWNIRFLTLLGLPTDLIRVGFSLAEVVAFNHERGEYDADDLQALLVNRDLASQTWPYVYERKRPDGMVLEIVYDRMAEGGYISTYTDVTERHRSAAALRRANEELERRVQERTQALEQAKAEAELANSGKTRFLAAASHDLLQPLNAARLYLAALDESLRSNPGGVESDQRDEERQLAGNAAAALSSTERLLDELLDISSYDSGAVRAQQVDFSIGTLLAQLELEFSALARQRGLGLCVVPCSLTVRTDAQLLRRVLQNLLSNAIRYTPKGKVLLGCRRTAGELRIEVRDTGIGIAENRQKEIFEEFRRLDNGQDREKGSGLGLAIVERICRLLDHPIEVRSQPGRGTSFIVTVPLAASGTTTLALEKPAVADVHTQDCLVVLCIDNDAAIRQGLAALISRWGHKPIVASDTETALANTNGEMPDLVLVDYHLESAETGLEVLGKLRESWGREIAGLMITADRTEEIRTKAQALGCEIMVKPVKPAALRRYLDAVALLKRAGLQEEERHDHTHRDRR